MGIFRTLKHNWYIAGRHLSMLPVEPKLGKMLILGAIFNCLDPIMTVVAGLSVRDPFLMPFDKKDVSQPLFSSPAWCFVLLLVCNTTKKGLNHLPQLLATRRSFWQWITCLWIFSLVEISILIWIEYMYKYIGEVHRRGEGFILEPQVWFTVLFMIGKWYKTF